MTLPPENVDVLRRRIRELEELHRLAESLAAINGQVEMLESIAECCVRLCHADKASIILLDDAHADPASTVVRSATTEERSIPHLLNSMVAGWMLKHRATLETDDLPKDLRIQGKVADSAQAGPALAVPLVIDGAMIGFVHLLRHRPSPRFTPEEVRIAESIAPLASKSIERGKMHESLKAEARTLREELRKSSAADILLGASPGIATVRTTIDRVATSNATVLLIGETGTGKELAARAIHLQSPRAARPFIAVNCAAIPDTLFESELFGHERGAFTGASGPQVGRFEQAQGGTLFLDEISSLPLDLQPKLLRVLEERAVMRVGSGEARPVDVRLIAASGVNLEEAVDRQEFRRDLFHRINVVPINLPSLRSRREDIPVLAQGFLREFSSGRAVFAEDAVRFLQSLPWKGNVRELRNVVERAALFIEAPMVTADDLHVLGVVTAAEPHRDLVASLRSFVRLRHDGEDVPDEVDKLLVSLALEETQGNISRAARLLGIDRTAFQRRIKKYGLNPAGADAQDS